MVICMELPARLLTMNMNMPIFHTVSLPASSDAESSDLPSSPPIGWTADVICVFLIFEDMGFALQGQT